MKREELINSLKIRINENKKDEEKLLAIKISENGTVNKFTGHLTTTVLRKIIKWMCSVAPKFILNPETLFRSVHILKLYLAKIKWNSLNYEELVLISVCCLNIACKASENNCNYLNFLYNSFLDPKIYTLKQMVETEFIILKKINFKVTTDAFYNFSLYYLEILLEHLNDKVSDQIKNNISDFNNIISIKLLSIVESISGDPVVLGLISLKTAIRHVETKFPEYNIQGEFDETLKMIFNLEFVDECNSFSIKTFQKLKVDS